MQAWSCSSCASCITRPVWPCISASACLVVVRAPASGRAAASPTRERSSVTHEAHASHARSREGRLPSRGFGAIRLAGGLGGSAATPAPASSVRTLVQPHGLRPPRPCEFCRTFQAAALKPGRSLGASYAFENPVACEWSEVANRDPLRHSVAARVQTPDVESSVRGREDGWILPGVPILPRAP